MEVRNRDRDALPFTTKDGSTIREYFRTDRQSLAEAIVAPGQVTECHYHVLAEELYSILEGGGLLEVAGNEREVAAGDTILIPPGACHRLTAGPSGARLLCTCVPPYSHEDTYLE